MSSVTDSLNSLANPIDYVQQDAAASSELGQEEFLQLLVTQLNYQDPLNPMENEEFIAQLAQFSSLEQLMGLNSRADAMAMNQVSQMSSSAISFIGKEVKVLGNEFAYDGTSSVGLDYELASDASTVTVKIKDADGDIVREIEMGQQEAGMQDATWDGMGDDGGTLPAGDYSFEVEAKDSDGNSVSSYTYKIGTVTGVTFDKGYPELIIGDDKATLSDVVEVLEHQTESRA